MNSLSIMKTKHKQMRIANRLLLAGMLGFGLSACDIDQTEEGEMPEVEVEGGNMPEYDVDGPEVEVGSKEVEVPTIDIDVPDEEDNEPPMDEDETVRPE